MSRVSTVLNRAADEIESRGKARGSLINRNGNVCALGAIRLASGAVVGSNYGSPAILAARLDWEIYHQTYLALDGYLLSNNVYKNDNQKDNGVAGWNDRNNQASVVSVMREAAKTLSE